jgi:hypothetical protein
MAIARALLVDVSLTRWDHCVTRCVRRACLLGEGDQNRKEWLENRLEELADIFAVAVGGFAVMNNHLLPRFVEPNPTGSSNHAGASAGLIYSRIACPFIPTLRVISPPVRVEDALRVLSAPSALSFVFSALQQVRVEDALRVSSFRSRGPLSVASNEERGGTRDAEAKQPSGARLRDSVRDDQVPLGASTCGEAIGRGEDGCFPEYGRLAGDAQRAVQLTDVLRIQTTLAFLPGECGLENVHSRVGWVRVDEIVGQCRAQVHTRARRDRQRGVGQEECSRDGG